MQWWTWRVFQYLAWGTLMRLKGLYLHICFIQRVAVYGNLKPIYPSGSIAGGGRGRLGCILM